MELRLSVRYVAEPVPVPPQNRLELNGGAPVLFWYTNQGLPRQTLVRIDPATTQMTSFHVRIPLRETAQPRRELSTTLGNRDGGGGGGGGGGGDLVLGVQAFSKVLTQDHRVGWIHAGTAIKSLAHFLRQLHTDSGGTVRLDLEINHGTQETQGLRKGYLLVNVAHSGVSGYASLHAQLSLIGKSEEEGYVRWNHERVRYALPPRLYAYLQGAYPSMEYLPATFPLSKNIRALAWQCAMGPLPFAAFWSGHTRAPLTTTYWLHLVTTVLTRYDMQRAQFLQLLLQLDDRAKVRLAGRVLADVLTAYATALPYLTDLYVDGNGRPTLIEWFDRLRLRCCGDCDDFGRDICLLHRELVTAATFLESDILMRELQYFASQYVCAGMLGAVTQPSVGAGNMRASEAEVYYGARVSPTLLHRVSSVSREKIASQCVGSAKKAAAAAAAAAHYGAHIWAMLTPRHIWAEWRGTSLSDTHLPHWLSAYGELLVCEGTGHMDAVVGSWAAPGLSRRRRYAAKAQERFFAHNPRLRGLPHTVSMELSGPEHVSPFYRQAMWAYAYAADGEKMGAFVDELYFVDAANGSHGVSFDALARYTLGTRTIRLDALAPLDDDLHEIATRALEYMCPEPSLAVTPEIAAAVAPKWHPLVDAAIGANALLKEQHHVAAFRNLATREPVPLLLFVPLDTRISLHGEEAVDGGNFERLAREHIERAVANPHSGVAKATYNYEVFDTNVVQLCVKLYLL